MPFGILVTINSRVNTVTAFGTVKFHVQNTDSIAKNLTLQETVTASEPLVETTDYSISFSGNGVNGKVDISVTNGEENHTQSVYYNKEQRNGDRIL